MINTIDKTKLTDRELLIFNQEVENKKKNPIIAYLLWWFTGFMGGHRYYFGKTGSAIAMTLIFWLLVWLFGLGALITGIWALVDVFLINGWLKEDNAKVEAQVFNDLMMNHNIAPVSREEAPAQVKATNDTPANEPEVKEQAVEESATQESPVQATPKFCVNCGSQLEGTMAFCPKCGTKIASNL